MNGDLHPLLASVCVIAFVVVGCVPWGMDVGRWSAAVVNVWVHVTPFV